MGNPTCKQQPAEQVRSAEAFVAANADLMQYDVI